MHSHLQPRLILPTPASCHPLMAPRKGESALERADRLQTKAHELQTKASLNRVVAAIKARPDLVGTVERQLISLGALDTTPTPRAYPTKPMQVAEKFDLLQLQDGTASESPGHGQREAAPAAQGPAPGVGQPAAAMDDQDDMNDKPFDKNITNFGGLSAKRLKALLAILEPVTFSCHNMKSMMKKGAREVNKRELTRLLEFATNATMGMDIPSDMRCMTKLAESLARMNASLGRRARDLIMPPSWEAPGAFSIQLQGESILNVTHNFRMITVPLHVPRGDGFEIQGNWSELGAMIRQKGGYFQQLCSLLFDYVGEEKHKPKRPRDCLGSSQGSTVGNADSTRFYSDIPSSEASAPSKMSRLGSQGDGASSGLSRSPTGAPGGAEPVGEVFISPATAMADGGDELASSGGEWNPLPPPELLA